MTLKEQIIQELEQSPEHVLEQVLNFILVTKNCWPSQIEEQPMDETEYLSASPANYQRLMASLKELESGKGVERELIE